MGKGRDHPIVIAAKAEIQCLASNDPPYRAFTGTTLLPIAVFSQRTLEHQQHRGRRTPDVSLPIRNGPIIAASRADHAEVPLVIVPVQNKVQRHFEYIGYFE